MKKIEHLGIAVSDVAAAKKVFEDILQGEFYKQEAVESEGVITHFIQVGESKIELLESTKTDGPIGKFLEKKGQGIHHIAFATDDIYADIERLKSLGYTVLNDPPKPGADGKVIAFLHPKDTASVLIELCMDA